MIVGIIAVIGACKKSDDSTTTTAAATTAAACSSSLSTTASGTLTGLKTTMGVDNVTGTYSMSWEGATPTAGCIDNGTAVSLMISYNSIPSDSQNFKYQIIVTSSTSFTKLLTYYSDNNSCATVSGYDAKSYTNFTVGDNITMATAPSPYPTYGTKVSYKTTCFMGKGVTDTATAWLNALSHVSGAVTGTEINKEGSGNTYYNIMALNDNHSGTTYDWFFVGEESTSAYPDNYSENDSDAMFQ
jgi:hypothetical protein